MQNSNRDTPLRYRERLTPSLPFFVAITLTGPMVALSFLPVDAALGAALGVAAIIAITAITVLLSPVVSIEGTVLRAGRAHIDVRWLGEPAAYTGEDAARVRGPELDARGWHLIRGGLSGVVVTPNTDPADPVRSWTISTRTPDRLAAAIATAREEAVQSVN